MPDYPVSLSVDVTADAAYIRFSAEQPARTKQITDAVLVDLDRFNVAVGVEVLELAAEIPFQRLITDFHVPTGAIDALRSIRPSISSYISVSQAADGTYASTLRPALAV